jgi:hypothetical protein
LALVVRLLLKAIALYLVHSLLLEAVRVAATMVLAHLVVRVVRVVERLVLTLAERLALEHLDKDLLVVLQPPLELLAAVVAAEQVQ